MLRLVFALLLPVLVASLAFLYVHVRSQWLRKQSRFGKKLQTMQTDGAMVHLVGKEAFMSTESFRDYFRGMSGPNLFARKCTDTEQCMRRYLERVMDPLDVPARVRQALRDDVLMLRELLAAGSARRLASQPWRVAILAGTPEPEDGFPHTHGNIVCLPMSHFGRHDQHHRVETLVHELIHVCQRADMDGVRDVLRRAWNYVPVGSIADMRSQSFSNPETYARIRSNPDLDGLLYMRGSSQGRSPSMTMAMFTDDSPRNLSSIEYRHMDASMNAALDLESTADAAQEHPFEHMAYACAHALASDQLRTLPLPLANWLQGHSR